MKRIIFILFIPLVLFFACNEKTSNNNSSENADPEVVGSIVPVDNLMKDPEAYVGKVVEVEGLVTHVCKHSGKRLHLTSPATNDMIRVEATGDIIQFERELEGSEVRMKGLVQKLVIDEDYLAKWENELSAKGEDHDHSQEEAETELLTNMRMRLENSGQDQLVSYWMDGSSFKIN
jgi:hypothetical protein